MKALPVIHDPAHTCAVECGSKCCRTPTARPTVIAPEMRTLHARSKDLGVTVNFRPLDPDVYGWHVGGDGMWRRMFLLERDEQHPDGPACPFLNRDTGLCRIYEDRPETCREFPREPIVGCLLNPGVAGRDRSL